MDYRGVVFANFNTATAGEELAGDFGNMGIFVWDGQWHEIARFVDATWMVSGPVGADPAKALLVAGFPGLGVWVWEYNGSYPGLWTQISGTNSTGAFLVNDDLDAGLELYVDFDTAGFWRHEFHAGLSWTQISAYNLSTGLRMNTAPAAVEEACVMFPTRGVWQISFESGSPSFTQLTGTSAGGDDHASANFTGGSAEDLIINFAGPSLWLCKEDDRSWHQIDTNYVTRARAVRFGGDPAAELLIKHATNPTGLWLWDYSGTWPGALNQLSALAPDSDGFIEPFDINGDTETDGDQEVAVDFGANGLWLFDGTSGSWTQLSGLDPDFMVAGDPNGLGYKNTLAVDFGVKGLWLYAAGTGSWTQLSVFSPDSNE
jgi:hypothetical protein